MLTNIQSLFADILQTPQQRAMQLRNEGLTRAELATRNLSGGGQLLAPLISAQAQNAPMIEDMIRRGVGGLFGQDTRTESESIQNMLSQADTATPEGQQALIAALRNQGYGAQAAQLQQMMLAQQKEDELAALQRRQVEASITDSTALRENQRRQLELDLLRTNAQMQQAGFQVANEQGQLDVQRRNAELRAEEIQVERERMEAMANQNTTQTNRFIMEATQSAVEERAAAVNMLNIASTYDNVSPVAGFRGTAYQAFNNFLGTQGDAEQIKTEYIKLRNSVIGTDLPPGAASDADILLALQGWPPENANAAYISRFLRGQAKMAALSAEQNKFKAEYISNNRGNVAGFMDEWDSRIAEEGFLESISTKYGVSFTNEDMPSNDDERTALLESLGAATESEPPRTSGQASRRPRK
jgi:hypothetical protein